MKVAVLQSNYIPWKGYFHLVESVDRFCFYDEVQFTKNDWRNRNLILGANGLQWMTIPVPSKSVKQKISEVEITDSSWQRKHLKTLQSAYGRAPHFTQLSTIMQEFLVEKEWNYLSQLNQTLVREIAAKLGILTTFYDSRDFALSTGRVERLLHLLKDLETTHYVSGPSARVYLQGHSTLFAKEGITIEYFEYPDYPKYSQVNSDEFQHGVSILDMIANVHYHEIPEKIWRQ